MNAASVDTGAVKENAEPEPSPSEPEHNEQQRLHFEECSDEWLNNLAE